MTDVARLAGVSHQTVSRVLNNYPHVRPRTRLIVLAAVRELGYQPNTVARALATGRTKTLGVITLAGTLYGPNSKLNAIEAAARDEGYIVSIASRQPGGDESVADAVLRMHRLGVAGVIVIAPHAVADERLDDLATVIPLVLIEGGLAVVSVDQTAGGRIATEHLLTLGHPTVWHIAGPENWPEATERTAGWREALVRAGAPVPALWRGDWSPASGYAFGREIAGRAEITAVFVANDQMALGLLRALGEHGRRVPDEVSVVGFDDIPEAGYFAPPLTTVRQSFEQVGVRSVRSLIAQIESDAPPLDRRIITPELVIRQSTAEPP
jgi:DNA-binding LacI/PurR family transcriptional regulator